MILPKKFRFSWIKIQIFLFFCCCFSSSLQGQEESLWIKGIVIDSLTEQVLEGVNLRLPQYTNAGCTTNARGWFECEVPSFPIQLEISYLSYATKTILLASTPKEALVIRLESIANELPEISVTAKAKVDTLFQEPYSVVDYEFFEDKTFLLAYKDNISKYSLIALDAQDQVVARRSLLDKRPVELHKNCLGTIQLITTTNAYEIDLSTDTLRLVNRRSLEEFDDFWEPCILANEQFVYFSRYHFQGQALQYYAFSKLDTSQHFLLPRIEDDRNIILLLEELGVRLPYSGEVWQARVSDRLARLRDASYQLEGFQKILYKPLYAPLVAKDSQLCIFNHFEEKIQYLTWRGDSIRSVPIRYPNQKGWKKKLYYDEIQQQAYTSFNSREGEVIYTIDMETGNLKNAQALEMSFIENIKVHDGYFYFLYRNFFVKERNRKLHKVRLSP
ncbi:MAG: carboxypeptidase-like regulatory domain-containing protein [Saprospiraceae bacterium]